MSAAQTCRDIRALGQNMVRFSQDTSAQLPQVTSLIADIENIKSNTQAAVSGSARNISLCEETLAELKRASAAQAMRP